MGHTMRGCLFTFARSVSRHCRSPGVHAIVQAMNALSLRRAYAARPVTAVAVLIALFTLANALLSGCGGNKSQQTTETPSTTTPPATATDTSAAAGATAGVPDGAKIYAEKCSVCHGAGGHGDGPGGAALNPKPRDHTNGAYMNARTDDQLLEVIRNGKGNMPAWKTVLSDDEIHAVLKHVRSLAVPPYHGS